MIKKINKNKYLVTMSSLLIVTNASWAQSTQGTQNYPNKTIRIIVALAPGGGVDTAARMLAPRFTEAWGQQVVAENRPGAGGTIAAELVARAAPDGYTLLMTSIGHTITPAMYKLSFDVNKDFAAISLFVQSASVLSVHPSLPVKDVKELLAFAKARPNQLLFSSSGSGSGQHLVVEMLNRNAGLQLVHIPYKGTAPSILDLVAGRVSGTAASAISTMPHVRSGRLRALAITGAKRSPSVPYLPTINEAGVQGVVLDQWYSLFAPGGTPRDIINKLYGEIVKTINDPTARERLLALALDPVGSTPEEFAAYIRSETVKWGKLVREAGIKAN